MDDKQKAMNNLFVKSIKAAGLDRFALGEILTRGQASVLYEKSLKGPVTLARPNTRRTAENLAASAADNYLRDPDKPSTRNVTTQLLLLAECLRVLRESGYEVDRPAYSKDGRLRGFPPPGQTNVSRRKAPGAGMEDHAFYRYVRTKLGMSHQELVDLFNLYQKPSSVEYRRLEAYISAYKELPPDNPKHKGTPKTSLSLLDVLLFMQLEGFDIKAIKVDKSGRIIDAPKRA